MSKPVADRHNVSEALPSKGAMPALSGVAAVVSILAASTCCLPIVPFVAAAGFAGGSAFFSAARPYLLGAAIVLIAYGFYAARQVKQCRRRSSLISTVLLWLSAIFVAVSIFFPQVMANAMASLLTR